MSIFAVSLGMLTFSNIRIVASSGWGIRARRWPKEYYFNGHSRLLPWAAACTAASTARPHR